MIRLKNCKRRAVSLMIVLVLGGMTGFAPADELLDMMPDNSLVCVRLNHFNPTLMKIDEFLAGASPVGISMFARMGLGSVFGNPMMPGVDQNGSFGAFVYARAPEPGVSAAVPPVEGALLVPMTDYKTFLESNPNCSEADAQGLSSLSSAQQQLPEITIAQVGGYALLGVETSRDQFIALRDSLNAKRTPMTKALKADQQKVATDAPLWIYFNMKGINATFGPMIQGQLMMVSQMMEQQMQAAPQAMPMNPAKAIGAYGDIINRFLTESESLTVTMTPKAEALSIRKTIVTVPDTDLAKAFVGEADKEPNPLLGHLKDGAAMNMAFNPSHTCLQPLNEWSLDLVADMFGQSLTSDQKEKIKQLAADSREVFGRAGVYTTNVDAEAKPPFAYDYILAVRDEARFRRMLDEGIDFYNSVFSPMYKKMGLNTTLEIREDTETHQGVAINEIRMTFDVEDANAPEAQVMKNMYGEGMTFQWALVNNTFVASMSNDKVTTLIDQVKAGVPTTMATEIRNALSLTPEGADVDMFVTFNLIRMFEMVKAFAPVPLPSMDFSSSSNIVVAASIGNGQLSGDLIIPKAHIMEIMQVVQAMMMQKAQQEGANGGMTGEN